MNMKKSVIALGIAGAMSLPAVASAMQVVGEDLEVYIKAHVSLDITDPDTATGESENNISSNSSRIGFKGKHKLENGMTAIYQIESKVSFDEANGNSTLGSRNTWVGLSDGFGTVLVGYSDTPFKDFGGQFTVFGDTVADRRAILGSSAIQSVSHAMDQRAKNMILYKNNFGPTEVKIMYSTDLKADGTANGQDKNKNDAFSGSIVYKDGPLAVGAAFESESNVTNADPETKVDGARVGAMYDFGMFGLGAIYEDLTSDDIPDLDRSAYGINGTVKLSDATKLQAQVLVADKYKDSDKTGASMASIGVTTKIDKTTSVYAIYTQTDNEDNAKFQGIGDGHDDTLSTDLGGKPTAFSLGLIFAI